MKLKEAAHKSLCFYIPALKLDMFIFIYRQQVDAQHIVLNEHHQVFYGLFFCSSERIAFPMLSLYLGCCGGRLSTHLHAPLSVSRMSKTNTTSVKQIQIECDTACSLWPPWSKCLVWRPSLSVCAKTHSCHSHPIQLSRSESQLLTRAQPQKWEAFLLLTCFLLRGTKAFSKTLIQIVKASQLSEPNGDITDRGLKKFP